VKTHAGKQSKKFQIIPLLDRNGSVDMDISEGIVAVSYEK